MPQAWWNFLRGRIATFAAGVCLAGAALLLAPDAVWALLLLSVAAAVIVHFVMPKDRVLPLPQENPGDTLALLPPLTRLLFEQLPMPVMLLGAGDRVLFVNQAMRGVLGPALERKHVSTVLRNPDVLGAIAAAGQGLRADVPFTLPVPIERHYQAYVARVSATPPTIALVLHDLTAIRRSEQMRADFIANASHELRTPLAAVSGFIDTLRGHARQDEAARDKFLEIMSVEAARMRRLIDDLLSLTRIELNEHVPPQDRIQLDHVVREAAAALAPLAQSDDITVEISGEPPPAVTGQRDELIQLFQNLIHNAIKYGRTGGHVWISLGRMAARNADTAFVTVRDDGEGIAASAVPRLTERFYRVDIKRSREKGGTGLGLAIVKHIVSRHQGRLQIDSKPGEGSSFTVLLPAASPENGQNDDGPAGNPAVALALAAPVPAGVTEML